MKATTSAEHEARRPQSLRPDSAHIANGARSRTPHEGPEGRVLARPRLRLCAVLLALLFGLGIALPDAEAQSKRRKKRRRGRRGKAAKVDRKPDKPRPADAPDSEGFVAIEDSSGDGPDGASDRGNKRRGKSGAKATTRESKGAQVFDFTGLELGGQLRMPQLLYFLDRANEELQKASLEERSFIPEMARSLDEERL